MLHLIFLLQMMDKFYKEINKIMLQMQEHQVLSQLI